MTTDNSISSALNTTTATSNAQAAAAAKNLTGTAAASSADKTSAGAQELSSNFTQFLQLLTTQLQNQDPLNPMDSSTFTQQLVEYSQVEQQLSTNSKLDNLTTLSMNSTLSLALGYVGKDITYTSSDMNYDGATPVDVNYNLPSTASTATLNITDSAGDLVYSKAVSGASGTTKVTWDGSETDSTGNPNGITAPSGTYSVAISATDSTGAPITATTAVTGLVRGVESQDGTPALLVGSRSVAIGNVIDVAIPSAPTTAATASTNTNTDTTS